MPSHPRSFPILLALLASLGCSPSLDDENVAARSRVVEVCETAAEVCTASTEIDTYAHIECLAQEIADAGVLFEGPSCDPVASDLWALASESIEASPADPGAECEALLWEPGAPEYDCVRPGG